MNRAILVLLLLIANAIVSSSKVKPPPPVRADYSLGRFAILDGASLPEDGRPGSDAVATPLCRRDVLSLQAARETATERRSYNCTGEDARPPLSDVRL